MDFANSVINAAAGQTAIWHDLRGVNTTLSGGTTAGLQALGYGADLVRAGRAAAVLAGGAEELCFESLYGFARAGWLAGTVRRRDGVGGRRHGAAAGAARPPPQRLPARRGGGAAGARGGGRRAAPRGGRSSARCSATAPPSTRAAAATPRAAPQAVARAVAEALADAGLDAGRLDVLSLSANGSVAGDAREARGLRGGLRRAAAPAMPGDGRQGGARRGARRLRRASRRWRRWRRWRPGGCPAIAGLEEPDDGLPLPSIAAEARPLVARTAWSPRSTSTAARRRWCSAVAAAATVAAEERVDGTGPHPRFRRRRRAAELPSWCRA